MKGRGLPPDARRKLDQEKRAFFLALLRRAGLPTPQMEYTFHPTRRWRFDYAWPDDAIALEVEGGVWTQGRHTRPSGYLGDVTKYNQAAVLGWRLLRVTPDTLETQATIDLIADALGIRRAA